jgi:putative nucleotidyltransferase with HDIG domain
MQYDSSNCFSNIKVVVFQRITEIIDFYAYSGMPIACILDSRKPTLFGAGFIFRQNTDYCSLSYKVIRLMQFDKSLSDKLTRLKHIPTLPHILLQLIKTCDADSGSLKELSRIIEKDPALTSRILRLVNSAYYSKNNRIGNVDGAVIFLGTNSIKNIAICSSVHEVLQNIKSREGFNLKHFWWHSLRCAILAKLIAKKQKFHDPDEAFLFGMLHDIGKVILWVNFPEQYAALLEKRKGRPDLILAGETQLGANHAEIGAWLLNKWNFQHAIADAVHTHHRSQYSMLNATPLSQFIYVANLLRDRKSVG